MFASILEVVVFSVFSYVLYYCIKRSLLNKKISFNISPTMIFYLCIEILTALFIAFFLIFLLQGWTLEDTHYNGYILFYSGASQTFMMTLRPVAVFSLGLDRCFCILFPFKYRDNKKFLPVLIAIPLMAISVGLSLVPRVIEFAPKSPETSCSAFGCMTSPQSDSLYVTMRYASSAVNLAMGLLLFALLRVKAKELLVKTNRLVLYTLVITFTLDLSPHLISGMFYAICNVNITNYIGPFSSVFMAVETTCCSGFYLKSLKMRLPWIKKPGHSGCHMVALNYQTGDKSMQLNEGKFMANGRCGYVLKPAYLMDETFKPDNPETVKGNCPIVLSITVIAGRQLSRKDKNKGICSPFVDIEIIGLNFDCSAQRTRSISSNGLNPVWQETFIFRVICPEMALIRFNVEDGDFVGAKSDPFIGQAVFPVDCLRAGFRSIPLLNQFNERQELGALLVKVHIQALNSSETLTNPHLVLQQGRTVYGQNLHSTNPPSYQIPLSDQQMIENVTATTDLIPNHTDDSLGNSTEIDETRMPTAECDSWYEQLCESGTECILKEWFCDGRMDCSDGSDEPPDICHHHRVDGARDSKGRFLPPTMKCPETWFFCRDASRCIEPASACNGVNDCNDGSDEDGFCHYLNVERVLSSVDNEQGLSEDTNSTRL